MTWRLEYFNWFIPYCKITVLKSHISKISKIWYPFHCLKIKTYIQNVTFLTFADKSKGKSFCEQFKSLIIGVEVELFLNVRFGFIFLNELIKIVFGCTARPHFRLRSIHENGFAGVRWRLQRTLYRLQRTFYRRWRQKRLLNAFQEVGKEADDAKFFEAGDFDFGQTDRSFMQVTALNKTCCKEQRI